MPASAYCTEADLYSHGGLPRGGLPNPGRLVASVSTDTDALTLDGHGMATDDALSFRPESGGSMPGGLVEGITYFAIVLTSDTFSVAAAAAGAAIDLTTAGENLLLIVALPIQAAIEYASALVDDSIISHDPQMSPVPPTVLSVTARIAATNLMRDAGALSFEDADQRHAVTSDILERWKKGVPVRGFNAPAAANLATTTTRTGGDARGWYPADGTLP